MSVEFKSTLLEYEDVEFYKKLFNITKGIDSCVYHYSVMSKEFLLELKEHMLFAIVSSKEVEYDKNYTLYTVDIYFNKREEGIYDCIELNSEVNLPIYSDSSGSSGYVYIQSKLENKNIYLTSDFNHIISILNINNYDYYNQIIENKDS